MDNRSRLLESLFDALIEIPSDQRAERLKAEDIDDDLQAELKDLLRHYDADEEQPDFLEQVTGMPTQSHSSISSPSSVSSSTANRGSSAHPEQIGPYQIVQQLGEGGMGTVYRVIHTRLQKHFALKVLSPTAMANPQLVSRFQREMEGVGQLHHENVIGASDAGEADGFHFLVMDFVDGVTVEELLERNGVLPISDACEIARQTAHGLEHAHSQGLIHRDIKPSNLMITRDGQLKIVDFGLAMLHDSTTSAVTHAGAVMGTVDYMSPEQASQDREVDKRTDIYSLGATLYKLLTGKAPLENSATRSLAQKLIALTTSSAPTVREQRDDLPVDLARLVDSTLKRDPDARPASAKKLAGQLEQFAKGSQLAQLLYPPANPLAHPPQTSHRNSLNPNSREKTATVAIASVILVCILAFAIWWQFKPPVTKQIAGPNSPSQTSKPSSWSPVLQNSPATRTTAAWPYLYCVTTDPVDQLGPVIQQLYEICEQHKLSVADTAVTLVYLDGSYTNGDWKSAVSKMEIRIRLYEMPSVANADLQAHSNGRRLASLGVRKGTAGSEFFVTKPQGVNYQDAVSLWAALEAFAAQQRTSAAYTAAMERYPADAWNSTTNYRELATELIIPVE